MKKMKKRASVVLALIMVLALAVPVAAAETGTGTITINNPVKGHTYAIYKIFDLESVSGTSYSYKIEEAWKEFVTNGGGKEYVNVDSQGYVTWTKKDENGADVGAAEFAKLALAWAKNATPPISADQSKALAADATETTVEFTRLDFGYYLVDSSVGTLCMLNTVEKDITIDEKNTEPTLKKEVKENSDNTWGETADAERGQEVEFRATIAAYEGAQKYIMHDKMDEGLTFINDSVVVTLKKASGTEATQTVEKGENTYKVEEGVADCTFHVVFADDFCNSLEDGDVIVVSYKATVEKKAYDTALGKNEAWLTYGDSTNYTTEHSIVMVNTWQVPFFKYYKDSNNNEVGLAGAVFELSRDEGGENKVTFDVRATAEQEGFQDVPLYRVLQNGSVTQITTESSGKFILRGLDSGTYYLREITAPKGYNRLSGPVKIMIDAKGDVSYEFEKTTTTDVNKIIGVKIENKTGSLLPSTGGIGTTIFYVVGGILVVGAAVLLVTRKRMSAEK